MLSCRGSFFGNDDDDGDEDGDGGTREDTKTTKRKHVISFSIIMEHTLQ